jgi:LmbE family N-acetylglucosaminyl deacetylase
MDEAPSATCARMQACPIVDGGTPVQVWTGWDRCCASLDIGACPGLTIVAPHPDDETLGLGATMATLCAAGVDVHVVSVSDGGAAHPWLGAEGRRELETVRCEEGRRAARVLGAGEPIRLGMPDGELPRHEQQLTTQLAALLAGFTTGTWCAATWRGDGHPDHEAVGRAAAAAAARTGAVFLEYPVWMWHWARPGDPAVPWSRARRVKLTDEALAMKQIATQCFSSQIEPGPSGDPVLPPVVVRRLLTVGEVVFV